MSAARVGRLAPVLASAGAAAGLLAVLVTIRQGPVSVFFLQPVVLVLATGCAYLLDDAARPVVAVTPRIQRRRAGAVAAGLMVTAGAWALIVLFLRVQSPSTPVTALTWEVAGVGCLMLAASALLARRGDSEPGNLVASAGGGLVLGLLVAQPAMHLSLLPLAGDEPIHADRWAAVIVLALTVTLLASRDAAKPGLTSVRSLSSPR